jgi:hypothetical protein
MISRLLCSTWLHHLNALYYNTTGGYNTATGGYVLYTNINGTANVAIVLDALFNNRNASNNTTVGGSALVSSTGSNNVDLVSMRVKILPPAAGMSVSGRRSSVLLGRATRRQELKTVLAARSRKHRLAEKESDGKAMLR